MNAKILQNISDTKFAIKSFGEWMAKRAEKMQQVLVAASDIVSNAESYTDLPDTISEGMVRDHLAGLGFSPDAPIFIADWGWTVLGEYVSTLAQSALNVDVPQAQLEWYDPLMAAISLNESYQSAVATCEACFAYASQDPSKVSVFSETLRSKLKNFEANETVAYFKDILSRDLNPSDFFSQLETSVGITEMVDQEDPDLMDCDFANYTGATPITCCTLVEGLPGLVMGAMGVVKGVASVYANLQLAVIKGYHWIAKKAYQTAINPVDLEYIEQDGNNTVDGLHMQAMSCTDVLPAGSEKLIWVRHMNSVYPSGRGCPIINKWTKFETLFGEIIFKISDWTYTSAGSSGSVTFNGAFLFKPKCVDFTNFSALLEQSLVPGTETIDMVRFSEIAATGVSYVPSDANERVKLVGLLGATSFAYLMGLFGVNQLQGGDTTVGVFDVDFGSLMPRFPSAIQAGIVTNMDFLWAATRSTEASINTEFFADETVGANIGAQDVCLPYVLAYMAGQYSDSINPLNTPWIPYSNGHTGWSKSTWRIKTDTENIEAFTKVVTIALVVVIVVAVAVTTGIQIHRMLSNLATKRIAILNEMQSKLASGVSLSNAEKSALRRASKKLLTADVTTSGIASSLSNAAANIISSFNDSESPSLTYSQMHALIMG